MTISVLQKQLIRFFLLASGLVFSSQVMGQGWDAIYANQTEGIRLRHISGSQSKDSLSVITTSNTIIWNSWGIGQTKEKFKKGKSGYIFDIQTSFVDLSYTIGESWTITLGGGIPSGIAKITNDYNFGRNTESEYKSSTVSGGSYFTVFGLEIGIFEFLLGYRVNNIEYTKFELESNTLDTKYKVSGGQTMIGLGLSFSVVK